MKEVHNILNGSPVRDVLSESSDWYRLRHADINRYYDEVDPHDVYSVLQQDIRKPLLRGGREIGVAVGVAFIEMQDETVLVKVRGEDGYVATRRFSSNPEAWKFAQYLVRSAKIDMDKMKLVFEL